MSKTEEISPVSSSSSSHQSCEVFLSFRGEDTRRNFTDHLYSALKRSGVSTFRDDEELERGKIIAPELLQAIEQSRFAVVVLSRNYADSTWCLEELAKIVDCFKAGKLNNIFPVFYNVNPSEVRKLAGGFGEAFAKRVENSKDDVQKVKRWKDALSEVGHISGWHLDNDQYESKVITEIVEKIKYKLTLMRSSTANRFLVGLKHRTSKIAQHMGRRGNDVLTIGIWGMGGIGKTTLAREFFKLYRMDYAASYFVENVRQKTARHGLDYWHNFFQRESNNANIGTNTVMAPLLHNISVLIILDDVDHIYQIKTLVGSREELSHLYGQGSRIIVTTRDMSLLSSYGIDGIYNVDKLTEDEALQLFCWNAFKIKHPIDNYANLSKNVVEYASGLPLALETLGSFLYGRNLDEWSSAWARLKQYPHKDIVGALQISFDGLQDTEKKTFLDIACFFQGEDETYVKKLLESCDRYPLIDFGVLVQKSLLTIDENTGGVWMHDSLQELGREIIRHESPDEPGNRSRLWLYKDVYDVLLNNKGTQNIEGILLSLPEREQVHMDADPFPKLNKLRFLKICNVVISGNFGYLSNELRFLEWHGCPIKVIPSSFQPDNLVELKLPNSRIEQLWNTRKLAEKLTVIDLSDCQYLTKAPDFSKIPNLETLILKGCKRLSQIHPSVGDLKQLVLWDMEGCESIKRLPNKISMQSLETFILSNCSKLDKFPEIAGDMERLAKLCLNGTAIVELPMSIKRLSGLVLLDLKFCKNLLSLPNSLCSLTSLRELDLMSCSRLDQLPENIGNLETLEKLDAARTAIRKVPSSIVSLKNLKVLSFQGSPRVPNLSSWQSIFCCCLLPSDGSAESIGLQLPESFSGLCSLKWLDLSVCNLAEGAIPDDLGCLTSLEYLSLIGNDFSSLPESINQLSRLEELYLSGCSKLKSLPMELPSSLKILIAPDYTLLEISTSRSNSKASNSSDFCLINWEKTNTGIPNVPFDSSPVLVDRNEDYDQFFEDQIYRHESYHFQFGLTSEVSFGQCSYSSAGSTVTIPLPPNLDSDPTWLGLALLAVIAAKVPENFVSSHLTSTIHVSCIWQFSTDKGQLKKCGALFPAFLDSDAASIGYCHYIPRELFSKKLKKASHLRASAEILTPNVEMKMCAAHLIYEQDVEVLTRNVIDIFFDRGHKDADNFQRDDTFGRPNSKFPILDVDEMECKGGRQQHTSQDPSHETGEDFIIQDPLLISVEEALPTEDPSSAAKQEKKSFQTMQLRTELRLILSKLLDGHHARNYYFRCAFPLGTILTWFTFQAIGDQARCLCPPNLCNDWAWVGFFVYVVIKRRSYNVAVDNLHSEVTSLSISLELFTDGKRIYTAFASFQLDRLEGPYRLLMFHVPKEQCIEPIKRIQSTHFNVYCAFQSCGMDVDFEVCGIQTTFEQDLKALIYTITECTLNSPTNLHESYLRTFKEMWTNITAGEIEWRVDEDQQNIVDCGYLFGFKRTPQPAVLPVDIEALQSHDSPPSLQPTLPNYRLVGPRADTLILEALGSGKTKKKEFDKKLTFCVPATGIPKVSNHSVQIELRKNSNELMGLALCAVFSVHKDLTATTFKNKDSTICHNLICRFETNRGTLEPLRVHQITNEDSKWLDNLGCGIVDGFYWISYIPLDTFSSDQLNQCSFLKASVGIDCPCFCVNSCDLYLLYGEQRVNMCKQLLEENYGTSNNQRRSLHVLRLLSPPLHDIRLNRSMVVDYQRKLKTWLPCFFNMPDVEVALIVEGINTYFETFHPNAKLYHFLFPRSEMLEWFANGQVSTSQKVKMQLPPRLYDDKEWTGFVVCAGIQILRERLVQRQDPNDLEYDILIDDRLGFVKGIKSVIKPDKLCYWKHFDGLIWVVYISRSVLPKSCSKLKSTEITFKSNNPGLEVRKCGISLLYQQDVKEFKKSIIQCVSSFFDDLNPFCQQLQDLHSSTTSYYNPNKTRLPDLKFLYNLCFPATERLEWSTQLSSGPSVTIQLPPNLHNDVNWKGFWLCAYFIEKSLDYTPYVRPDLLEFTCHLQTERGNCLKNLHVYDTTDEEEFTRLSQESGFVWLSYIPRGPFQCNKIEASFESSMQNVCVQKCGIQLAYCHDENEFIQGLSQMLSIKETTNGNYGGSNSSGAGSSNKFKDKGKQVVE